MKYFKHETAVVDDGAVLGENTKIWHFSHVCAKAVIGESCHFGQSGYVDNGAEVGNFCKIQNNVNIYEGVKLEDYVFCGPSMTFTNVKVPRCKYPTDNSKYYKTTVKEGASIGAHAVVVCGITIGKHAMIGSGSVVTKDVPDFALMVGNPARQIGWVCECGAKIEISGDEIVCSNCKKGYQNINNLLVGGTNEQGNQ